MIVQIKLKSTTKYDHQHFTISKQQIITVYWICLTFVYCCHDGAMLPCPCPCPCPCPRGFGWAVTPQNIVFLQLLLGTVHHVHFLNNENAIIWRCVVELKHNNTRISLFKVGNVLLNTITILSTVSTTTIYAKHHHLFRLKKQCNLTISTTKLKLGVD